ncbi:DUF2934 domain-containing protein [Mesorhizobium sp. SP-1A]|uniref:DUF2934 domain-containing protein n=1 Tax=Mesorhizobium sp. SP-1A TaxID=3077840 RepID=UPI0028F73497|nr:DUF2934 domain-containing protein [Mesorhizobium sp. SP-1A]
MTPRAIWRDPLRERNERYARLCRRAREIWEQEGQPIGRHEIHWLMAIQQIDAEDETGPQTTEATIPEATFTHAVQVLEHVVAADLAPAGKPKPRLRSSRR